MAPLLHDDDKLALRFLVKATFAAIALLILFWGVLKVANATTDISRVQRAALASHATFDRSVSSDEVQS